MPVVGMVGGGQLARMTAAAAVGLGATFRVLAESANESAALVTHDVAVGSHLSLPDITAFAADCDVITFDHEHVPGPILAELESAGVLVRPGSGALRYTQDKLAMRQRLSELGIPCPRFAPVASLADVAAFVGGYGGPSPRGMAGSGARYDGGFGHRALDPAGTWPVVPNAWPVVLKAVSGGYDGRGVWICETPDEAAEVLGHGVAVFAEEYIGFDRELAALAARSPHGQGAVYPVVQTVQRDGVCHEVLAPAPWLAVRQAREAQQLALELAAELDVTGLLAVELFETAEGLLVNELAMRPHNSGHWTIDGSRTSQFEQHLRAVLNLPLGDPSPNASAVVMVNVLGGEDDDLHDRLIHVWAADPGVKVHLYGKEVRPGRKVGHVTVAGEDFGALRDRVTRAANYISLGTEEP